MKFSEIKDSTAAELSAKSRDLRQEMFNLRLQQASAQLEKPARLRQLRRNGNNCRSSWLQELLACERQKSRHGRAH